MMYCTIFLCSSDHNSYYLHLDVIFIFIFLKISDIPMPWIIIIWIQKHNWAWHTSDLRCLQISVRGIGDQIKQWINALAQRGTDE